ncbi:hypothetical protein CEB3_c38970 [Peptococcaceae bacterium CEB3]|nr:hypothetical protein CEB3_c38970 [Peptococcaceae bacterium CEB3]
MRGEDDSWIPAFRDEPVASESLGNLHNQIMAAIRRDPVDFHVRMELARRRRWGLAFAASWLSLGLICLTALIFMPQVWWSMLLGKIRFAVGLGIAVESLWREYSWQLTGFAVTAGFLIAGLKGRTSRLGMDDTRATW